MRRLMWFTVGFTTACAFTAYIVTSPWLLAAAAGILSLGVLARVLLPAGKMRGITLSIVIGVVCGLVWFQVYDYNHLRNAREMDGNETDVRLIALDYSSCGDTRNVVECQWQNEDIDCRVLLYLQENVEVAPGDILRANVSLRYTGQGGNDGTTYHWGDGISLLAYPNDEVRVIRCEDDSMRFFPVRFRRSMLESIDSAFSEDTSAFMKALLLGYTEELSYKTDTDLKISGIRHVVAVSGLHVSFLLALIFFLVGRRGIVAFCISLPLLLFFGAVIGFTPSVIRACVMQLLLLLAAWTKREYDSLTALAMAVLLILGMNPQTVVSVGFQLSVGCVLGIILFSGKILQRLEKLRWVGTVKGDNWKYKIKRYILSSISVSLGATVLTVPLSAMYFGTVGLAAPLTNILCLWLISFLFLGGMACCAVGAVFPAAAAAVAWVLSWGIRFILWIAGAIAKIPFSAVYTQDVNIAAWIVIAYLLLLAYACIPKLRKKLLLWLIPGLLIVAVAVSVVSVRLDNYRLTVLNVGQGQCVLLQADGRSYMVDCGGSSGEQVADTAAAHLLSQGIYQLDGLILTHYDADHVNGVPYLLDRIEVETLYLPSRSDDKYLQQILEAYPQRPKYIGFDELIQWEDSTINIFPGDKSKSNNENSACILFQKQECAILITGDRDQAGEIALLQEHRLPEVDILVVGHHGSDTSTSSELLRKLEIEKAVISVGEGNRYGHPEESVLRRLEMFGCTVYRTDRDGTVVIRG